MLIYKFLETDSITSVEVQKRLIIEEKDLICPLTKSFLEDPYVLVYKNNGTDGNFYSRSALERALNPINGVVQHPTTGEQLSNYLLIKHYTMSKIIEEFINKKESDNIFGDSGVFDCLITQDFATTPVISNEGHLYDFPAVIHIDNCFPPRYLDNSQTYIVGPYNKNYSKEDLEREYRSPLSYNFMKIFWDNSLLNLYKKIEILNKPNAALVNQTINNDIDVLRAHITRGF
ncbi:MAG: U-box domain [Francisellaceae bacterium]|nr:U-box domain [Francisellaceae bacterium]